MVKVSPHIKWHGKTMCRIGKLAKHRGFIFNKVLQSLLRISKNTKEW